MENFLELRNVSLIYHTKEGEIPALADISFTLNRGEFISVVGPSGCGKTTILSLIAGLFKQTSGSILLEGKPLDDDCSIGYMFQRDHLFEWRTIYKNVMLGLELNKNLNTPENAERVKQLLEKYGLSEFSDRYPNQLSGGMRQRAALIRTLALQPKILLLDEPFSALDYQTKLKVCDDVKSIIKSENQTVISVTHDISEAISMSDRVIILSNRPAIVKKIVSIDLDKTLSPLARRESAGFSTYFDNIWKELST